MILIVLFWPREDNNVPVVGTCGAVILGICFLDLVFPEPKKKYCSRKMDLPKKK
jgi:hypothetical protein